MSGARRVSRLGMPPRSHQVTGARSTTGARRAIRLRYLCRGRLPFLGIVQGQPQLDGAGGRVERGRTRRRTRTRGPGVCIV